MRIEKAKGIAHSVEGETVSSVSAATGLKSGQFDRKRNFGNVVSYEGLTKK
ncbi:MAG: hypothetical protein JRF47_03550 [Deltaproteobacteria bacterium]|nr:hypothetical protein [Deltaproteobacteria bacterium]